VDRHRKPEVFRKRHRDAIKKRIDWLGARILREERNGEASSFDRQERLALILALDHIDVLEKRVEAWRALGRAS